MWVVACGCAAWSGSVPFFNADVSQLRVFLGCVVCLSFGGVGEEWVGSARAMACLLVLVVLLILQFTYLAIDIKTSIRVLSTI